MKRTFVAPIAILTSCLTTQCLAGDLLNLRVAEATRGIHQNAHTPVINVRLSENSAHLFGWWTSKHVRETCNIEIDGRVVTQVRVLGAITGGMLQVSGPSAEEMDDMIPKLLDGRSALSVETKD